MVFSVPWVSVHAPETVKLLLIVRLPVKPVARTNVAQLIAADVVTAAAAGELPSKVTVSAEVIAATLATPPVVVAIVLVTPS